MLVSVEIVHFYFLEKFYILFQGKEWPAKTKLMPEKLCAVLDSTRSVS